MALLFVLCTIASSVSALRSLSSSDVRHLLVEWNLHEKFDKEFAAENFDGRHLQFLQESDYSATRFPRASELDFKVLMYETQ